MRILAIDTALSACSACVMDAGFPEPLASEQLPLERGHAEALLPLIERVVAGSGGGFAAIDRIAVTVGPGSFTGLRVGVSAARAFALALEKPAVGVSTLAALAAPLIGRESGRALLAVIDARHGSVYALALDATGQMLHPPQILPAKEAARLVAGQPVSLVGSGAVMVAQEAWGVGLDAVVVDAAAHPQIAWVARLGAMADPDSALPRPLYLRAPDAQPQDNGRVTRSGVARSDAARA